MWPQQVEKVEFCEADAALSTVFLIIMQEYLQLLCANQLLEQGWVVLAHQETVLMIKFALAKLG